jgi:hypothetical protein
MGLKFVAFGTLKDGVEAAFIRTEDGPVPPVVRDKKKTPRDGAPPAVAEVPAEEKKPA